MGEVFTPPTADEIVDFCQPIYSPATSFLIKRKNFIYCDLDNLILEETMACFEDLEEGRTNGKR